MNFEFGVMSVRTDLVDLFRRIERAAGHIVRVFKANEGSLRVVVNPWPNHSFDFLPIEYPVVGAGDARHGACNCRHGGEFVKIDVAALLANDFVAMMRPDLDGDEVAHAAAGDEKRGFLAEDLRGALLEPIHGRIFKVNVVADLSFGHGAAHSGRGPSHGIAAEVNDAFGLGCRHFFRLPLLRISSSQAVPRRLRSKY